MIKMQNRDIMHSHVGSNLAFTLVELLIVVAIIAILAVIALPNFLEAQIRAKVSRAKSDLRAVSVGLEMYAVDNNDYPPDDGYYNILPIQITTPIAYLTDSLLADPFADKEHDPRYGALARYYSYFRIISYEEFDQMVKDWFEAYNRGENPPAIRWPAVESIDSALIEARYPGFTRGKYNPGALERYGAWRMVSNGPDRRYVDEKNPEVPQRFDITYDPTNGTISAGNIFRTQKQKEIQR